MGTFPVYVFHYHNIPVCGDLHADTTLLDDDRQQSYEFLENAQREKETEESKKLASLLALILMILPVHGSGVSYRWNKVALFAFYVLPACPHSK
jgi:hypothetical protein